MNKKIVIKLGGSTYSISDKKLIDYEYLDSLKVILMKYIENGDQFAISLGGGYLTRKYQSMARQNGASSHEDLDWIGIATINLNADTIKAHWTDICENKILRYDDFKDESLLEFQKPIQLCAAEEPGHSSDVDAVKIAKRAGSKIIFRLTDVDAIYTKDPGKFPDAEKISKMTWDEYFEVLGITDFIPGGHYPIDPIAARMAKESGLSFYLMSGRNLENFSKALNGEGFEGTVVTDN